MNLGVISKQISGAKSLIAILGREYVLDLLHGHLPGKESMIEHISKEVSQRFLTRSNFSFLDQMYRSRFYHILKKRENGVHLLVITYYLS